MSLGIIQHTATVLQYVDAVWILHVNELTVILWAFSEASLPLSGVMHLLRLALGVFSQVDSVLQ